MAEVRIEPLISEVAKTSEQVISDHMLHSGLKCNKCNSLFKTKWIMNNLVASVHDHICDASFVGKRNLNKHVSSAHEGKKPFKCNVCGASYTSNQNMKIHIDSVHEGRKPFHCNICDASFAIKSHLNKHVASV